MAGCATAALPFPGSLDSLRDRANAVRYTDANEQVSGPKLSQCGTVPRHCGSLFGVRRAYAEAVYQKMRWKVRKWGKPPVSMVEFDFQKPVQEDQREWVPVSSQEERESTQMLGSAEKGKRVVVSLKDFFEVTGEAGASEKLSLLYNGGHRFLARWVVSYCLHR